MRQTAKFTVSMPQADFKALEDVRRRVGQSRSAFVLEAVRARLRNAGESGDFLRQPYSVDEERIGYGPGGAGSERHELQTLVDPGEIRKRAMAAAGRFQSKEGDLSIKHDEMLADAYAETDSEERSQK